LLESSVDVFSIHDLAYLMNRDIFQGDGNGVKTQYSIIPIAEQSGAKLLLFAGFAAE